MGELELLGQGQAAGVIQAFLKFWTARHPQLRRVLIDPESRNTRAIQVYQKAGFRRLAGIQHGGQSLQLMLLEPA